MIKVVALCMFMVGCASTRSIEQPQMHQDVSTNVPPPGFVEYSYSDDRTFQDIKDQAAADEEAAYNHSIEKISATMADESLKLEMCEGVYGKNGKEYKALLKQTCEIDMLVDSRSGHHSKPYCNQKSSKP